MLLIEKKQGFKQSMTSIHFQAFEVIGPKPSGFLYYFFNTTQILLALHNIDFSTTEVNMLYENSFS